MSDRVYITTTLPYVNSEPHIGYALEVVQADVYARLQRLIGNKVFFNVGTDEHGLKIYRKALENKESPREYVDRLVKSFDSLKGFLDLSYDNFVRTSSAGHISSAQEFWRKCLATGDIYKKQQKIKYCVGCELEKTDSELVEGVCPIHPNLEIEIIEEENYFFKFSKYQEALLSLYQENPSFVLPASRQNEIRSFVERGLSDFSISRLKEKMPWGVPVPDDDEHVMYVWFDALVNYVSAIGWPEDMQTFDTWWPVIQFAGKDNLRQQSAIWQAMLLSAGLKPSKQVVIHGFITSGGQKISKSLGNGVNPVSLVSEYGTDALRYFLIREISPFEDGDFTTERFKEAYNANLANGLGNLTSRIMKMAEDNLTETPSISEENIPPEFINYLNQFEFQKAADLIWFRISELDQKIQNEKPFSLVKSDPTKAQAIISELVVALYTIGCMLNPIMPDTSSKIKQAVKDNKKPETLFLRK